MDGEKLMEAISVIRDIGQILGIPAALGAFWLYMSVRSLQSKVRELETGHDTLRADLSQIKSDVAYIRGKMERRS